PGVLDLGVEEDAVLLARQDLAEPAEADERGIVLPHRRLEGLAEAGQVVGHARVLERSSAALEVVAADEVRMFVLDVAEARYVRRHRTPVVQGRLGPDALRDEAAAARAHGVLAEVTAEQARRVPHPLRVPRRARV